jgi:hypothetical protein
MDPAAAVVEVWSQQRATSATATATSTAALNEGQKLSQLGSYGRLTNFNGVDPCVGCRDNRCSCVGCC